MVLVMRRLREAEKGLGSLGIPHFREGDWVIGLLEICVNRDSRLITSAPRMICMMGRNFGRAGGHGAKSMTIHGLTPDWL